MATIPQFDPSTTEATSPFLAGLSEGMSRIATILNLTTTTITDSAMSEVYIGESDRYRIYQVAAGNRLWLSDPAPVVKKNGSTITPAGANFTIDYIGGSIKFESIARLTSGDTVTVSATRIASASTEIEDIKTDMTAVEAITAHFMGYYATLSDLQTAHVTGVDGDFAIIGGTVDSIYMWDSTGSAWKDIYKTVDLSTYYTKSEADALLSAKEASITAHGATTASDLYYYGGRKTWQELTAKVRATVLTGIDVATSTVISASDTILGAIGKLQAQITGKPFISGAGDPTTSTVGTIGQRYVNTSTGAAFRCTAIAGSDYTWVKQGSTDDLVASAVTNAKLENMANNTIKGNVSGSAAAPSDLSAANVRTIINVADGADVTRTVVEAVSEIDAIADGDGLVLNDASASAGAKTKFVLWSAIKTALSLLFTPKDGWIPANETWAYASATTITVPSGAASKYRKGDKIKLTQTTVKYFYIIGVADTVLTITAGSTYTLAAEAISKNYYSKVENPQGFPEYFNLALGAWTTLGTAFTNQPSNDFWHFSIKGSFVTIYGSSTTNATSGGAGIFVLNITAGQIPTLLTACGIAVNNSVPFSGICAVLTSSPSTVYLYKYDGSTIAASAQNFSGSITAQY